jgi:hypothetical protein
MKLVDRAHPFYQPLWRRIFIVAVVALWLAFELAFVKETLWIAVAAGFLAYAVWAFLIAWKPDGDA